MESNNSLQSICYKPGSLQLLDQRKLPLEAIYLDIKDAKDGWSAIRDMVVRGAPAIAIAAALSLAVEVSNLPAFDGTPDNAASFLIKKLEYLVSSRPTAVNLSDAATKLKEVISNAAATTSEAQSVFQAYIEAAQIMLEDDVASNKAIGSYGASVLQHLLKDSKRLSILTHCNTGSLATAGYGTALGVIRAVHTEGFLERAYCTETRPFNQVRWSNFVKPTGAKLGPVLSDPAQRAEPTKAQNEFLKNLERLTERSSWEVGEGSGEHAEKAPKLSLITDELGGDLPRADERVEEVLTCDFLAGPQCSDGSDPHGPAEKLLLVVPGSGELGGVFPRSDGHGDEIGAVGGLPVGHKSSGAEASGVGDTVTVTVSPAEDFPNSGDAQNSIGQSVNADSDASPSLSVFESYVMARHHKLLGKNDFYPLPELGFDSKEEEVLLLDWVNPKGSSQDEESRNTLDCVPLAKWDPHGGLDIVSEAVLDDFFVGEDLEPSMALAQYPFQRAIFQQICAQFFEWPLEKTGSSFIALFIFHA
nr:methylthioribose-1-phosphate isomerase [Quercus suber]